MRKAIKESEVAGKNAAACHEGRWYLFCPGCFAHARIEFPGADREITCWHAALHCFSDKVHQFHGSEESPTLSPSLLVTSSRRGGNPYTCHSFVKDGRIQFLPDCSHSMAGQTVELLDVDAFLAAVERERQEREAQNAEG